MIYKILITGASGFLGQALFKQLLNTNHEIHGLAGRKQWDLTKQRHVDYAFQQYEPDVIVHLAARVGGIGANKKNPGLFMYENLAMGMNLIETARKYGKLKKFIMVGTVCSYPKHTKVPFCEEDLWKGYPEETNAPYGIAKKALMEMLIAYNKQYGFNCTNLIPVNMYGPHDNFDPEISHVIPAIILKVDQAIQKNLPNIEIWGTGQASREFLYIDDCARAICRAIEVNTTPYPINIGNGSEYTIKELTEKIVTFMGYKGGVVFNQNGLDGQPRRCLNVTKAKSTLGFEAEVFLNEGLKRTINWYNQNREKFVDYLSDIQ